MVARIQLLFLVPALLIDLTKAITPGLIEKIRWIFIFWIFYLDFLVFKPFKDCWVFDNAAN